MRIGDLIFAKHRVQFDVDPTAFGRRHGEQPDANQMFESDSDLVRNSTDAFDSVFDGSTSALNTIIGTVVSGDKFIKDPERLKWLQREFGALATEVGGASVVHTCQFPDVPFVFVPEQSDTADENVSKGFQKHLDTACWNSHALMEKLISAVAEI